MLIVPSLIRMYCQSCKLLILSQCLSEHVCHHFQVRATGECIRYNLSVVHVQYGRNVQFLILYADLLHICGPFLVRSFGREVPVNDIRCNLSGLTFIGVIVTFLPLCFQANLRHEFPHGLVVDHIAFIA